MFDLNSAYSKEYYNNPNPNNIGNQNQEKKNEQNQNLNELYYKKNSNYKYFLSKSFLYFDNINEKRYLKIDRDYYSMSVNSDYNILVNDNIIEYKEIDCILGMIDICNQKFILIVYQSLKVAKINQFSIFQIQKVDLIQLSKDNIKDKNQYDIVRNNLQKLLSNGSFFYSIGYDLSNTTETKFLNTNQNYDFLSYVNSSYLWNFNLLNHFNQYNIEKCFIATCICGFVGYKKINFEQNNFFGFIIIERINQKYNLNQNDDIKQNKYSLTFKQIECITTFPNNQIFSFIFYQTFFPFYFEDNYYPHYSQIIDFSNELNQYSNFLSIISSDDQKLNNSVIQLLKHNNHNLNKMFFIESKNYNFQSIETNNNFINFTDFFSYYYGPNNNYTSFNQNNIYWLISLNKTKPLDDDCIKFIARFSWIFLKKVFQILNLYDIGFFSNDNTINNPILKYYKDILLFYRKFQIHQSDKNNEEKEQIKLKTIVDYINSDKTKISTKIKSKNRLNLLLLTWNIAGISIKNSNNTQIKYDISDLFTNNSLYKNKETPDLIGIGLQEIVKLEVGNILLNQNDKSVEYWKNNFLNTIKRVYPNEQYILIKELDLVGIFMIILIKKKYFGNLRIINSLIIKNGMMGSLGNKGNVILVIKVFETFIAFCSGHYTAGHSKNKERLKILDQVLKTEIKYNNIITLFQDFDMWFIFGDLNFRINYDYETTINLIKQNSLNVLLESDQFYLSKKENPNYSIINEGHINFFPTYKYEKNGDNYSYNIDKIRVPSYCDRIFFKNYFNDKNPSVILKEYNTIQSVKISDHRPVYAIFNIFCTEFYNNEKEKLMNDLIQIENNDKIKKGYSDININNGMNVQSNPIVGFPELSYSNKDVRVNYPQIIQRENQINNNNININTNNLNNNNDNENDNEKVVQNLESFYNVKNENFNNYYNSNQNINYSNNEDNNSYNTNNYFDISQNDKNIQNNYNENQNNNNDISNLDQNNFNYNQNNNNNNYNYYQNYNYNNNNNLNENNYNYNNTFNQNPYVQNNNYNYNQNYNNTNNEFENNFNNNLNQNPYNQNNNYNYYQNYNYNNNNNLNENNYNYNNNLNQNNNNNSNQNNDNGNQFNNYNPYQNFNYNKKEGI